MGDNVFARIRITGHISSMTVLDGLINALIDADVECDNTGVYICDRDDAVRSITQTMTSAEGLSFSACEVNGGRFCHLERFIASNPGMVYIRTWSSGADLVAGVETLDLDGNIYRHPTNHAHEPVTKIGALTDLLETKTPSELQIEIRNLIAAADRASGKHLGPLTIAPEVSEYLNKPAMPEKAQ